MKRTVPFIHIARAPHSQHLVETALAYRSTLRELISRLMSHDASPDVVHAIRIHCRRLQALLELYADKDRARVMARAVRRLSKLRALQVFRQYLDTTQAIRSDLALVDAKIHNQVEKLQGAQAYEKIDRAVREDAIPQASAPQAVLLDRLDVVRLEHQWRLQRLLKAVRAAPTRKRLHALRLRLKTIRYQSEWFEPEGVSGDRFLKRLIRVQGRLGRYEELADFRRWGKQLSAPVRDRIQKDWKRARTRARAVPGDLAWLPRALGSQDFWRQSS